MEKRPSAPTTEGLRKISDSTFMCDDCDRAKPLMGSMCLVRSDPDSERHGEKHFVCAGCWAKYKQDRPS
jgi:hypothetical protein